MKGHSVNHKHSGSQTNYKINENMYNVALKTSLIMSSVSFTFLPITAM